MNYQDKILNDIKKIVNIPELNKQDLFAVIHSLIDSYRLQITKPDNYITEQIWTRLREFLLDGDSFDNGISIFKEHYSKWKQYQYKNSKVYKDKVKQESDYLDSLCNYNPEENMDYISNELLKNDEIYFLKIMENKKALYEKIMRAVAVKVKSAINEGYSKYEDIEDSYTMNIKTAAVVISDPCYALTEENYDDIWGDECNYQDGIIGDNLGLVHRTFSGDGGYSSSSGRNYGVDAGALGVYDINYCRDIEKLKKSDSIRIIKLNPNVEHEITLTYDNGTFYIFIDNEEVECIYTGYDEDEDEEDEYFEDEFYDEEYDEDEE